MTYQVTSSYVELEVFPVSSSLLQAAPQILLCSPRWVPLQATGYHNVLSIWRALFGNLVWNLGLIAEVCAEMCLKDTVFHFTFKSYYYYYYNFVSSFDALWKRFIIIQTIYHLIIFRISRCTFLWTCSGLSLGFGFATGPQLRGSRVWAALV